MKLDLGLQVKLTQSLIMTPQLQQAIKLLQLSRHDLEKLINQTLTENPALELEGPDGTESADDMNAKLAERLEAEEGLSDEWDHESSISSNSEDYGAEWQDYLESGAGVISESRSKMDDEEDNILENTITNRESLSAHLLGQIDLSFETEDEKTAAEFIIANINEDGYLALSLRQILETEPKLVELIRRNIKKSSVKPDPERVAKYDLMYVKEKKDQKKINAVKKHFAEHFAELHGEEDEAPQGEMVNMELSDSDNLCFWLDRVLSKVQTFDPPGIGARSLLECLLIQLEQLGLKDELPYLIVKNDFNSLIKNDIQRLPKKYHAEEEAVMASCKIIRDLEPKPGRPYSFENTQYVIPDVFISKRGDRYVVRLNEDTLPKLRINQRFLEMATEQHAMNKKLKAANRGHSGDDLTEAYMIEKIKAGEWLLKSIDQRQRTIYKVAESILKNQREFFDNGVEYLKPMILKDIAEDIEVHESTVSRITNNKFVHTPQGIFELKFFFTSGIQQEDGESISSKKIKDIIYKTIQSEDPKSPYTDSDLADKLEKDENIRIARRTIAKYREALKILPSNRRKRVF